MRQQTQGNKNRRGYFLYAISEIVLVVIGILIALAINNWNDNRKEAQVEHKILTEISNGLDKDLEDIYINVLGHNYGMNAARYFKKAITGQKVQSDSLLFHYFNLTRDFISIQNTAGYETLKSRGLELIRNDSLRLKIISLYEYDYTALRKLEEEYYEMQFQANYFKEINEALAPNFVLDDSGEVTGIKFPLTIREDERSKLLLYLWKIDRNRAFVLQFYKEIEEEVLKVRDIINRELQK